MALFEFSLDDVASITPWGDGDKLSLSWFALTLGTFHMQVGEQTLFRYTDAIVAHLDSTEIHAEYQLASVARDMLGSYASGVAVLPRFFEDLAADRSLFENLSAPDNSDEKIDDDVWYNAWRWVGERSPWTRYFVANPKLMFVRIGGNVHIRWDNRDRDIDDINVWTAEYGEHVLSVDDFEREHRDFANRLLAAMIHRIDDIEAGRSKPQIAVDVPALRAQHETWRLEFAANFRSDTMDIPWPVAEAAIRSIAAIRGIALPW